MDYTVQEVIRFAQENDVKFVKLAFCDLMGRQKNVSIMVSELPRAFKKGISFDGSAVRGFSGVADSDLLLKPDPATLAILPWRPQQGRVARLYCRVEKSGGRKLESDPRRILASAVERARRAGLSVRMAGECEFYLFELDERGRPTLIPQDDAGYCDTAPFDKAENVRREICLTLEEMGIQPECSHHERGPGQNEVDFRPSDPMSAADALFAFKSVVRMAAASNGLYASFMPKPLKNQPGSGLHVNISIGTRGQNITDRIAEKGEDPASRFLAGILKYARHMSLFLNPLTNSYRRLGVMEAPGTISWGYGNRSAMVRIPDAAGDYARMEVRSPDPAINPYIAFALLIHAGLEGIDKELSLMPPCDVDLSRPGHGMKPLCASLGEALNEAQQSEFLKSVLPQSVIDCYIALKEAEYEQYKAAPNPEAFDYNLYFHRI
ncbi:MAG: glutamine synthetase family protein [Christensenellales bacterium]|jgi:glutamine synthetase